MRAFRCATGNCCCAALIGTGGCRERKSRYTIGIGNSACDESGSTGGCIDGNTSSGASECGTTGDRCDDSEREDTFHNGGTPSWATTLIAFPARAEATLPA
jgi:hypothetical protein